MFTFRNRTGYLILLYLSKTSAMKTTYGIKTTFLQVGSLVESHLLLCIILLKSIENQTNAETEIAKMVLELIDIMPSTEYAALFKNAVRALKGKKEKFIDLYYEVANSLSEQLADADVDTLEPDTFEMVQD